MSKLIFYGMLICTISAYAELPKPPQPNKPVEQMTKEERKAYSKTRHDFMMSLAPEQRSAYREQKRAARIKEEGGLVRLSKSQTGQIVLVDLQDSVKATEIDAMLNPIRYALKADFNVIKPKVQYAKPEAYLKELKANGVILIADDATESVLLVSPEEKWAKINIAKLKGDKLASRLRKEIARSVAYLCGGIGSQYPNPLVGMVSDPRLLDDMPVSELPADVMARIKNYLPQMGVTFYEEMTYWQACRTGKAPAPTNEVQKAIWEEIHNPPSKPLKVKFDPVSQKGKVTK